MTTRQKDDRSIIERSVSFLLLGLICIFALNSIGNVQKYVSQYHHHWTGDALGIAFGTVVFVCAYIAATTSGQTRWVAIVLGSVFGFASAHFQTDLYISEGMEAATARSLSYIPILAGEVGLALLESLYSKQHREQTAVQVLPMRVQKNSNKQGMNSVGFSSADAQMPVLQAEIPALETRNGDLVVANQVRSEQKQQRKAAIPHLLSEAAQPLTTGELAEQMQSAFGWKVSIDSIRRYCQELLEEQVLETSRRKWYLRSNT